MKPKLAADPAVKVESLTLAPFEEAKQESSVPRSANIDSKAAVKTMSNGGQTTEQDQDKSTAAPEINQSSPMLSASMTQKQFSLHDYFKITQGATQQVLIVHDNDESIADETAAAYMQAPVFAQSHTELLQRPMSFESNRSDPRKRNSCGNAEVGVVLSENQHAMMGTLPEVEDATAEVDEREEYSNDFQSSADGGASAINYSARDSEEEKQGQHPVLVSSGSQNSDQGEFDEAGATRSQDEEPSTGRKETQPTMLPVVIQEVLRVETSSQASCNSQEGQNSLASSYGTVSGNDNQEVVFREVLMPSSPEQSSSQLKLKAGSKKTLKIRPLKNKAAIMKSKFAQNTVPVNSAAKPKRKQLLKVTRNRTHAVPQQQLPKQDVSITYGLDLSDSRRKASQFQLHIKLSTPISANMARSKLTTAKKRSRAETSNRACRSQNTRVDLQLSRLENCAKSPNPITEKELRTIQGNKHLEFSNEQALLSQNHALRRQIDQIQAQLEQFEPKTTQLTSKNSLSNLGPTPEMLSSSRTFSSKETGRIYEGRYSAQRKSPSLHSCSPEQTVLHPAQREEMLFNLEKQIVAELKQQRIKTRECEQLSKLKQKLRQTQTGESLESILYRSIFHLESSIKSKEKEVAQLKRTLKTQDFLEKKYAFKAHDGRQVSQFDLQCDSMQRQIGQAAHQLIDAEKEAETLSKRRANLEEMVQHRSAVLHTLLAQVREQDELLATTQPLHDLKPAQRQIAMACIATQRRLEQIEEEKTQTEMRYKTISLALDKKIGVQRIRITNALSPQRRLLHQDKSAPTLEQRIGRLDAVKPLKSELVGQKSVIKLPGMPQAGAKLSLSQHNLHPNRLNLTGQNNQFVSPNKKSQRFKVSNAKSKIKLKKISTVLQLQPLKQTAQLTLPNPRKTSSKKMRIERHQSSTCLHEQSPLQQNMVSQEAWQHTCSQARTIKPSIRGKIQNTSPSHDGQNQEPQMRYFQQHSLSLRTPTSLSKRLMLGQQLSADLSGAELLSPSHNGAGLNKMMLPSHDGSSNHTRDEDKTL